MHSFNSHSWSLYCVFQYQMPFFPHPSSSSLTSASCPAMQSSSDTPYPRVRTETRPPPQVKGPAPQAFPHLRHQLRLGSPGDCSSAWPTAVQGLPRPIPSGSVFARTTPRAQENALFKTVHSKEVHSERDGAVRTERPCPMGVYTLPSPSVSPPTCTLPTPSLRSFCRV